MNAPEHLLAKSARKDRPHLSLERHLLETEQAAVAIFRPDGRWWDSWCRFFRLQGKERESFLLHLQVAGLLHDLGKANEDFLRAVTARGFHAQTLRHEHISALVMHLPEVRAWLTSGGNLDVDAITAAVLSHHLKAAQEGDWQWCQPVGALQLTLFLQHPEVRRILERIARVAGLVAPPELTSVPWHHGSPWKEAWDDGVRTARRLRRECRKSQDSAEGLTPRWRLLLALKAGLIVADSVASGLFREGHSIDDWVEGVAHRAAVTPEDLEGAILAPRIARIEQQKGEPFVYHNFQDLAAQQPSRALLLAACGAGKSMAAWRWAKEQLRHRPLGRVIFLYPTRGTATEGFRDYVGLAPEMDAALLHGTARYELEAIQSNPEDRRNEHLSGKTLGLSEEEQRLYALAYWSRRYFSATVDQFLGFLEHSYSGMCLLPALADSAVIIDEVHSFDSRMFSGLISFLKQFDVPVLCMTATLSAGRRQQLSDAGLRVFPDEQERGKLEDLERLERHPRYALQVATEYTAGRAQAMELATRSYEEGKRVLWVVNRVSECQKLAEELEARLGERVWCYHSRFTLEDRKRAHEGTIAAFQQRERAAIAVTTQVCEMSLDLDADVLITEMAPFSSLVQRFGRSNRHLVRGMDFRATLLVYPPRTDRPYDREDMGAASQLLSTLAQGAISQRDLTEALEQNTRAEPRAMGDDASFLLGGYYAVAGAFRDADELAERCVLERDLPRLLECVHRGVPHDGFLVSVPRSEPLQNPADRTDLKVRDRDAIRYLRIAPDARYDSHLGYRVPTQE